MVDLGSLIAFLIFICILLFGVALYLYSEHRKEREKFLRKVQQAGEEAPRLEKSNPLEEMKNQWVKFIIVLGRLIKPKSEGELPHLRKALLRAGFRGENAPLVFWGFKILFAIGAAVIFISIKLLVAKPMPSFHVTLLSVLFALVCFHLPNLWLRRKIAARKDRIRAGLPDALDLMVVCVEAGIGVDGAINRIADELKLNNKPVSEEFKLLSLELRAGKSRQDALRNLALRTDLEEVSSLVTLLVQTERFGTSIAQALRIHSDSMRTERFQKAEQLAAKLPVKLVFPLVLFILPSLFFVILGPAAITVFRSLMPRMGGQ